MLQPIATDNPEIFRKVIQQDEYAIGALLVIYANQTEDEKADRGTKHQNGHGFNGTDGGFGSSLAEQYLKKGRLTEKQLAAVKKILPKYHGQVSQITPREIKPLEPRKEVQPLAELHDQIVRLEFPFNPQMVARVKNLPGRRWNATDKRWEVPLTINSWRMIEQLELPIGPALKQWVEQNTAQPKAVQGIPGLKCQLREFQKTGVGFIDSRNGRALIGDDMGLGKTAQALAWLQLRKDVALPALVVCPASMKIHWARKTLEWTELEPVLLSGKKKMKVTTFPGGTRRDVYVTNYDIIHAMTECGTCWGTGKIHGQKCKTCQGKGKIPTLHPELKKLGIKTVVFDEIHYNKTKGAGRTTAGHALAKSADFVIGLSGTPITNRPVEFFEPIKMIDPVLFPSWWNYTKRYCNRTHNGFGWDTSGSSNALELNKILTGSIMIRRLKSEVLTELPPKERQVIPIEIDTNKYNRAMDDIQVMLETTDNQAEHLAIIEKAKQLVVKMKMKLAIEWIRDYTENEKLVVFADHRETIEQLHQAFPESVVVYGGTSQKGRQEAVDRFQNDPKCRVFLGSKAAKEGLTLVAASATAFIELWWTPGDHDQAEDRVNRIGQEAQSISAYYLLAAGTIEEDIARLLDHKRKVVQAVLDGKDVQDFSLMDELLKKMRGQNGEENQAADNS